MAKYNLGQQVRYNRIMTRCEHAGGGKWGPAGIKGEGIIVGKRTCSDGYMKHGYGNDGVYYCATKYHNFWLVAHNLTGYRYVAEEDIKLEVTGPAEARAELAAGLGRTFDNAKDAIAWLKEEETSCQEP